MVLFLTAHLPEGFPRVSQPQAGSRQTFRLAFISVASSLLSFSFRCFVFLPHFPSAFHMLIHYSLSPSLPRCFLGEFEEKLVFVDVFCVHCVVSIC